MSRATISPSPRQTRYCQAIETTLAAMGHASNADILSTLKQDFPDLSATTVHRATARLSARGIIGTAPPGLDGSMRYDANTSPHDHFQCLDCGELKDVQLKDKLATILEDIINDCSISGPLMVSGTCKICINKEKS